MNKLGSNPFGVTTVIGLQKSAAKVSKDGEGGEKKVDLVQIYLTAVPSLQKAKTELESLRDSLKMEANNKKCEEWVQQIVKIMEEILDYTKVAIRGEIEEASPARPAEGTAPAITPGMISGKEPIPQGLPRNPGQ